MALVASLDDERKAELSGHVQFWESDPPPTHELPAWMLSMTLHVTLVLAVGFLMPAPRQPVSVEPDRTAGIALVNRHRTSDSYDSDGSPSPSSLSEPTSSAASALPSLLELPNEAEFSLPTTDDAASVAATAGIDSRSAQGLTQDSQPSNRVAGSGAKTRVFGAEGSGSKFVYVFDRSASMQGFQGRPMVAAKSELIESLNDLASVHQFQIVFYNERVSVFRPLRSQPPRMMFGSDENKRLAELYVRATQPAGATRHMDALELALGMHPDVMFFLTDAAEPRLTAEELVKIQRRNGGVTAIHTIEFGSGPYPGGDNFLVQLARQNGGQHVYVDVSRLP